MKTFGLHGGGLNPKALRRDMGDPHWIDHYLEKHDPLSLKCQINEFIQKDEEINLVGYSMGGSAIGHLSKMLDNIRCVVLYEAPLIDTDTVGGDFPVLWIRNDYESTEKREEEFNDTLNIWINSHPVKEEKGEGRHAYFHFGWPPFKHGWDKNLNEKIRTWIEEPFVYL